MPVGSYRNFVDCVSKNQDKDSPESYCGSIKAKVKKKMNGQKILKGIGDLLTKQGPPGPPPRPGLKWNSQTHRWRHPQSGNEFKHSGEQVPEQETAEGQRASRSMGGQQVLDSIQYVEQGQVGLSHVREAVGQLLGTIKNLPARQDLHGAFRDLERDPYNVNAQEALALIVDEIMQKARPKLMPKLAAAKGALIILRKQSSGLRIKKGLVILFKQLDK